MLLLSLLFACTGGPAPDPGLPIDDITRLVRDDVEDDRGWAVDVRDALVAAGQVPDRDHVCQVLAVIEQESGYEVDPAVPDLGRIVEQAIDEELDKLGPLAPFGKEALLDHVGPGAEATFAERLRAVRTEREVDELFREIVAFHEQRAPAVGKAARLLFPRLEERLNPIATAGSMQVSVSWAQALGEQEGLDARTVRDLLYTRRGGVRYGTARLFTHEADYDRPIYRFADYNAGVYASRNAAFQTQLAELTELSLTPDGDVLLYTARGKPRDEDGETMKALLAWRVSYAPELPERQVRRDARLEKERAFEDTDTWRRVRADWAERTGKEPDYARIPDISLDSPKLAKHLTTRWFAEKVDQRYRKCLKR